MNKLKQLRETTKLSQSKFAELVNIPVRTLQCYEQGSKDINAMNASSAYKICKACKCSLEDLLDTDIIN